MVKYELPLQWIKYLNGGGPGSVRKTLCPNQSKCANFFVTDLGHRCSTTQGTRSKDVQRVLRCSRLLGSV